ncbi:MAG: SulP family inorganic anion transporter [Lachnospiraceae bacterium]|nr:SulP family inorganic anion transporter [Lachnospiraceae bacterium]
MRLITHLRKGHATINYGRDIFGGIVVALVSIPISMGYAQIAGLPPVYGLYGSLLPIILFGLLTTSRQFVVGVDAMPAVIVGTMLAQMGVSPGSEEALLLVPFMTLLTAVWFLVLYLLKAGRIVKYVSTPVMGGFISGVGFTIILMQIPKLFGGDPGTGEVIALITNIFLQSGRFHLISFILGFGTVLIILLCKKLIPRVPMTVIMMLAGAVLQIVFHLDRYGVKVMAEVAPGLPQPVIPGYVFSGVHRPVFALTGIEGFWDSLPDLIMQSLGIAAVIMAQTLLASGNYAAKYHDSFDNNSELLAYGAMNLASAFFGSCPINGSVSRSGIADSQGVRSQLMSVSAGFTMLLVLLFGTPLIRYLPVPVLTGIVITALIGILELKLERKLWHTGRNEWMVFMLAFLGVMFFGTLYGIIIGVVLSFGETAIRSVSPPTAFVGRIPGHGNFYSLKRNSAARPVKNTVIYRFSGNLFFANIDFFCNEIEGGIKEDTHQVVVDARGIGNVDMTAVGRLVQLYTGLRERGILFYLTEHDGSLNDQLRKLGGNILIEEGAVRRTITLALRDAGLEKPYDLEDPGEQDQSSAYGLRYSDPENAVEAEERLSEFEWVFGDDANEKMEYLARSVADELAFSGADEKELEEKVLDEEGIRTSWGMLGRFDEDEFWDLLEIRLEELKAEGKISSETTARIERHIERRRSFGQKKLSLINPGAIHLLNKHEKVIRNYIKHKHPNEYEKFLRMRKEQKADDKGR